MTAIGLLTKPLLFEIRFHPSNQLDEVSLNCRFSQCVCLFVFRFFFIFLFFCRTFSLLHECCLVWYLVFDSIVRALEYICRKNKKKPSHFIHYGCHTDCKLLIYNNWAKKKSNRNMCILSWSVIFRSMYEFKQFPLFFYCFGLIYFLLHFSLLLSIYNSNNVKRAIHLDIFFASALHLFLMLLLPLLFRSSNVRTCGMYRCVCAEWNVWSTSRRSSAFHFKMVFSYELNFFFFFLKNDESTDRRSGSVGFLYAKLPFVQSKRWVRTDFSVWHHHWW